MSIKNKKKKREYCSCGKQTEWSRMENGDSLYPKGAIVHYTEDTFQPEPYTDEWNVFAKKCCINCYRKEWEKRRKSYIKIPEGYEGCVKFLVIENMINESIYIGSHDLVIYGSDGLIKGGWYNFKTKDLLEVLNQSND